MKKILLLAIAAAALALCGCSSTNDQGVTVSKGWFASSGSVDCVQNA